MKVLVSLLIGLIAGLGVGWVLFRSPLFGLRTDEVVAEAVFKHAPANTTDVECRHDDLPRGVYDCTVIDDKSTRRAFRVVVEHDHIGRMEPR